MKALHFSPFQVLWLYVYFMVLFDVIQVKPKDILGVAKHTPVEFKIC